MTSQSELLNKMANDLLRRTVMPIIDKRRHDRQRDGPAGAPDRRLYDSDGEEARIALEQATPKRPLHLSAAAADTVRDALDHADQALHLAADSKIYRVRTAAIAARAKVHTAQKRIATATAAKGNEP